MPQLGGSMSPNPFERRFRRLNQLSLLALLIALFAWSGCRSSEEVARQNNQALSSFLGDMKPKITSPPPAVDQKKLRDLEAENTTLKGKITKLEQDNGALTTRLSDIEAKIMAEQASKQVEPAKEVEPAKAVEPARPSDASYEAAYQLFRKKKYDEAIQMFQALLDGGIREDLADHCHYWMGESYFAKKNYREALNQFEAVFQYKFLAKRADAQYMTGRCYERLGDKGKAKAAYERVTKDYPTSGKARLAKERWGKL
jgi:tol-pal system protein YbgF